MNAVLRNALLDESWKVAIASEIDADPCDLVTPYTLGELDAMDGLTCDPTRHYSRLGDVEQYCWGYQDASAAIETDEYEEDILDREWHSRGQW